MGYQIEYKYDTGDTFGTYPGQVDRFSYVFKTKELAQAALKRLKEHWNWQLGTQSVAVGQSPKPSWWKPSPDDGFAAGNRYMFNVVGNDGEDVWLYAYYLGYFESLREAHVVLEKDPEDDDKDHFYV